MTEDHIHHYTSINTLALILKNRTIRFNRLDKLDDITEEDSFNVLKISKCFFVSCWTYDPEESIPQWNMYTEKMAGVRITLPQNFFNYQPLELPDKYNDFIKLEGKIISPIPFEKMITDTYLISPNFFQNIDKFAKKVEYVKDFRERKNALIEVIYGIDNKSISMAKVNEYTEMICLKDPVWFFQKEFRFVLLILPSLPFTQNNLMAIPEFQKNKILKNEGPDLIYFDVDINPKILSNIQITTGPLCTESEIILVESLLEKYVPNGKINKSKFYGTIRKSR
jgi:hypothetical protein